MLDELLILKKIKGGDIKAFEELFRRYYFPLCCYAAGITGQLTTSNPEQSTDPHQQMEYEELERFINGTLEKLPVRRRRIFEMHRLEGRKYVEIATQLSLSVKTVEAEMTKALRTLREEVEIYIHMK